MRPNHTRRFLLGALSLTDPAAVLKAARGDAKVMRLPLVGRRRLRQVQSVARSLEQGGELALALLAIYLLVALAVVLLLLRATRTRRKPGAVGQHLDGPPEPLPALTPLPAPRTPSSVDVDGVTSARALLRQVMGGNTPPSPAQPDLLSGRNNCPRQAGGTTTAPMPALFVARPRLDRRRPGRVGFTYKPYRPGMAVPEGGFIATKAGRTYRRVDPAVRAA